jgi:hypothetical protein
MNDRKKSKNFIVDLIFTLTLFGAFAVSSIMVVYFGARVYEKINSGMDRNFTSRTAVAYTTEKLRQRDSEGTASITELEGKNAIILTKKNDEVIENTYIYSEDGYLMETTVSGNAPVIRSEGARIMEIGSFTVKEVAQGIYNVIVVDNSGNTERAFISSKCDPKMRGQATAAPTGY